MARITTSQAATSSAGVATARGVEVGGERLAAGRHGGRRRRAPGRRARSAGADANPQRGPGRCARRRGVPCVRSKLIEEALLNEPGAFFGRHLDVARREQEDLVGHPLHAPVERVGEAAGEVDEALGEIGVGALKVDDDGDVDLELVGDLLGVVEVLGNDEVDLDALRPRQARWDARRAAPRSARRRVVGEDVVVVGLPGARAAARACARWAVPGRSARAPRAGRASLRRRTPRLRRCRSRPSPCASYRLGPSSLPVRVRRARFRRGRSSHPLAPLPGNRHSCPSTTARKYIVPAQRAERSAASCLACAKYGAALPRVGKQRRHAHEAGEGHLVARRCLVEEAIDLVERDARLRSLPRRCSPRAARLRGSARGPDSSSTTLFVETEWMRRTSGSTSLTLRLCRWPMKSKTKSPA